MSEYQYYEFVALDRPLSVEARNEIKQLSSRVQLTATTAIFVYNYSNFRGDPKHLLSTHFDMMLHITNWGTRQLMMRLPNFPLKTLEPYTMPYNIEVEQVGNNVLLNIEYHDDSGDWDWVEGEGLLAGMIHLRETILRGDLRAVYMAWLKFAEFEYELLEEDEDLPEPPVPPNLGKLSAALRSFCDFFVINLDLVTAAAQASATTTDVPEVDLASEVARLSEAEMRDFLIRLLKGEAHLDLVVMQRLQELAPRPAPLTPIPSKRTLRELFALADKIEEERIAEEKHQAELAHTKRMNALAPQATALWEKVYNLIALKQVKSYDEAVAILVDLKSLAKYQGQSAEFEAKMQDIRKRYPTLSGLRSRMDHAKL